ncbi:EF-hand domain-containing protein [Streptomyces misionensis]|uniref:EF-hand domain-containing protein n=1 Tax=Streptomyces misionensis TaxID=67331 RepID=A0A5C6ITT2_9ACTN|nr:EF-hand domain-containing protein [Streptomyces misionensis]TWV32538.1 EF-hand domain-containing protein [Streptomyces misionensis]
MSTSVANERLAKRFDKWDTDGNGVLDAGDFESEAERIAQNLGKNADSPEVQELNNAFRGLYEYLAQKAGVEAGGAISRQQFLDATGDMLFKEGEASFNRALSPIVKALIRLCDDDHDGQINAREFQAWLSAVGVPVSQAGESFQKVDKNDDGQLSEDELLQVVREFHFGQLEVELLG